MSTLVSEVQAKTQEKLGNKDYAEQPWTGSIASSASGKKTSPGKTPQRPGDFMGCQRKTTCSGSGMGIKVCIAYARLQRTA